MKTTRAPRAGKYRKKPVVIHAFQWQGDFDALDAWFNELGYSEDGDDGLPNGPAGIREDHNPAAPSTDTPPSPAVTPSASVEGTEPRPIVGTLEKESLW